MTSARRYVLYYCWFFNEPRALHYDNASCYVLCPVPGRYRIIRYCLVISTVIYLKTTSDVVAAVGDEKNLSNNTPECSD